MKANNRCVCVCVSVCVCVTLRVQAILILYPKLRGFSGYTTE